MAGSIESSDRFWAPTSAESTVLLEQVCTWIKALKALGMEASLAGELTSKFLGVSLVPSDEAEEDADADHEREVGRAVLDAVAVGAQAPLDVEVECEDCEEEDDE